MERTRKSYEVNIVFEGVVQYTVEAKNEEDAKKQADALFAEESPSVIQANVMQTTTTVDKEVDAI